MSFYIWADIKIGTVFYESGCHVHFFGFTLGVNLDEFLHLSRYRNWNSFLPVWMSRTLLWIYFGIEFRWVFTFEQISKLEQFFTSLDVTYTSLDLLWDRECAFHVLDCTVHTKKKKKKGCYCTRDYLINLCKRNKDVTVHTINSSIHGARIGEEENRASVGTSRVNWEITYSDQVRSQSSLYFSKPQPSTAARG